MDDTFPRRKAFTGGFRRGAPRSAASFGDANSWRVRYLCSAGPTDPVLCLHEVDHSGRRAVLADPRVLLADDEDLSPAERARRERLREGGAGITGFSSDDEGRRSVFTLSGQLWLVDSSGQPQRLPGTGAVVDPRISPDGRLVAYCAEGALRLLDIDEGTDRSLCAPQSEHETWGLAEFIAAEEMDRYRGFWWAPDSRRLLVAAVDESEVGTWWIGDPADPAAAPRPMRYPAAGTSNAAVDLWLVDVDGGRTRIEWDARAYPYLARVHIDANGALCSVQSRDQQRLRHLRIDLDTAAAEPVGEQVGAPWVDLVPGSPRFSPDGDLVTVTADRAADAWRLRKGDRWLTDPQWYVRSLLRCDDDGIWVAASQDPREAHVVVVGYDGALRRITPDGGWHQAVGTGPVPVVAVSGTDAWHPRITVGDPRDPSLVLPSLAEAPTGAPRVHFLPPEQDGQVRVAVLLPQQSAPAPVIVSSYGGPHAQRVVKAPLAFATEQWLADQGFAVVVIDGRGSPGVAPSCEAAISGDLASAPLADQITGLELAAAEFPGRLDTGRVGIRGWSFGGYLAALAVLRAPDVFRAAFAGAPVTEWRLYDTHYTERYLGLPDDRSTDYDRSSLLPLARDLRRPLCLVHGMADDNVVAAHTLQLSAALTAAGRPHEVLPLPGVSHMTPGESITENLLHLELAFFRRHLGSAESSNGPDPRA